MSNSKQEDKEKEVNAMDKGVMQSVQAIDKVNRWATDATEKIVENVVQMII